MWFPLVELLLLKMERVRSVLFTVYMVQIRKMDAPERPMLFYQPVVVDVDPSFLREINGLTLRLAADNGVGAALASAFGVRGLI